MSTKQKKELGNSEDTDTMQDKADRLYALLGALKNDGVLVKILDRNDALFIALPQFYRNAEGEFTAKTESAS